MNTLKLNKINKHLTPRYLLTKHSISLPQALPSYKRKNNRDSHAKGFTIIEVVLVLAIAGLIFLMVFIALPALQRSQRDTQRKNDLNRVLAAVKQYQANNKGLVPPTYESTNFVGTYLRAKGEEFKDPDGNDYFFRAANIGSLPTMPTSRTYESGGVTMSVIYVTRQAKCSNNNNTVANTGSNNTAYSIVLEGGGAYCVNN